MGNEIDLLRLLNPVVRPDGVSGLRGPGSGPGEQVPIESRSFDSILEEARQLNESESAERQTSPGPSRLEPVDETVGLKEGSQPVLPGLMQSLIGIDRVENGSLRDLIGSHETHPKPPVPPAPPGPP